MSSVMDSLALNTPERFLSNSFLMALIGAWRRKRLLDLARVLGLYWRNTDFFDTSTEKSTKSPQETGGEEVLLPLGILIRPEVTDYLKKVLTPPEAKADISTVKEEIEVLKKLGFQVEEKEVLERYKDRK